MNVILIAALLVLFITKLVMHYKLMSYRKGTDFISTNNLLDSIMPFERRVLYMKIYLSSLMFPVLSKAENDFLKKKINLMVVLFYIVLISLIWINLN